MEKSTLPFMPVFFDRYIHQVEDIPLLEALEKFRPAQLFADQQRLQQLGDQVYEEGKWTVRDILQHCIDTERIMSYRALRIARNDQTPLPGFEENDFAQEARAQQRSLTDLMEEFEALRMCTLLQFKCFDADVLLRQGTASGQAISVAALGFTIAGHALHHRRILQERYFPLLDA
ncbi:DinB family protein [Arundinibacter roseus]|uniref:DinB family protein n=1 Tax=Arundinibacter roseus TaxID=2070510 RepID=A0A4R4KMY1_9BACT|nr:DinB family protein [Arundinibacter roseus]TDB68059.1 DinB family protein [Arundinibacter roseus]